MGVVSNNLRNRGPQNGEPESEVDGNSQSIRSFNSKGERNGT